MAATGSSSLKRPAADAGERSDRKRSVAHDAQRQTLVRLPAWGRGEAEGDRKPERQKPERAAVAASPRSRSKTVGAGSELVGRHAPPRVSSATLGSWASRPRAQPPARAPPKAPAEARAKAPPSTYAPSLEGKRKSAQSSSSKSEAERDAVLRVRALPPPPLADRFF